MISIATTLLFAAAAGALFPSELVSFQPHVGNPLFTAGAEGQWDSRIRERGWILQEDGVYHLWYTGYDSDEGRRRLGYATSADGFTWTRYPGNPLCPEFWVEDVCVVRNGAALYMFAEGEGDRTHLLRSEDRIHWVEQGTLDVRKADGSAIDPGPFGTPAVWHEGDTWYLFYEREDLAIWLATSKDLKVWKNLQDAPVLERGPEHYDTRMIAANQIIKQGDCYYMYYHANCIEDGRDAWTMNVAASKDLLHWEKYPGNPVVPVNHSSGVLVPDGNGYRMYCMHPQVNVFVSTKR